jgi:L-gulonate 5-dehydrogenase
MMITVAVEQPGTLAVSSASQKMDPGPGEVLVRVARGGICGSDLHILHGSNPFATYPRVIGHEVAGEIGSVGTGVVGLRAGDRVAVDPVISCGHCYPCRIGRSNVCSRLEVIGVHRDGGFRSEIVIPAGNAIKVSPDLPLSIAALAEPFSIAANVLDRTGCRPDDVVLVYGAGTIGLTVLQVARMKGARCLVADVDEARLARAREFGADVVIPSRRLSVSEAVAGENDGLGPTVIVDAAGVPALLEEAVAVASPAARIGILGFSSEPSALVQRDVVRKELTIAGSRLSRKLLPEVVRWLEEGRLRPEAMITQTFPAEDARAAFDLIERTPSAAIKVQLAF